MKKALATCGFLGILYLAGCGGGGGGSSSSAITGGSGRAAILITDGFREQYTHVWATIYHVEAVPQGGGANVILFDSATGVSVDLRTLHDSSGSVFSFLGSAGIPVGVYTGLKVTVGPTMQLFLNGATTGTTYNVDSSIPKDVLGNPVLSLTFKTPKTVTTATTNMIVDFNLANFVIRDSKVIPSVEDNDGTGLSDPARQCAGDYHGTVSALTGTAPTLAFTLTTPAGATQTVVTTASTALYGDTLANGSAVEVSGTFDTTTNNLVATRVEVEPAGSSTPGHGTSHTQFAMGAATVLDATAGTFTLTVARAQGFVPATTTISIATSSTTVYRLDSGATATAADFFTALAKTPNAVVKGTYDATTNTLTATGIFIDNPADDKGGEHEHHDFRHGGNSDNWGNDATHGHHGGND